MENNLIVIFSAPTQQICDDWKCYRYHMDTIDLELKFTAEAIIKACSYQCSKGAFYYPWKFVPNWSTSNFGLFG